MREGRPISLRVSLCDFVEKFFVEKFFTGNNIEYDSSFP
jgi:hypothetical protein